jgi:hypothetical protein
MEKEKMSRGKKVAWALTICYLISIIVDDFASKGGSFAGILCFVLSIFCVYRFGPVGIWLFWTVIAVLGAIMFPVTALQSLSPLPRGDWYVFLGCVAFAIVSLFSFFRWNLLPDRSPFEKEEIQNEKI